ncbi:MAG: ATP-binding protein [Cyanobacteria bacterium J06621_11]
MNDTNASSPIRWKKALQRSCLLATLIVCLDNAKKAAIANISDNEPSQTHVLVVHSYDPALSWTRAQKEGINQSFQNNEQPVTVYHEFLDAKRHPELPYQQAFLNYIEVKYENTPLALVMVSDDPGLNLILDNRDEFFPTLPIVFMGINSVKEELLNRPLLTGVFENHSQVETIVEAVRQTQSTDVVIISDSSSTSQANLLEIQSNLAEQENAPNLIIEADVVDSEIADRLGPYPDHWPVYFAGQLRADHASGLLIPFEQETEILRSQLPNPLYTDTIMRVGHGTVGGKVLDGNYHAQQAVQLAQTILSGTPAREIAPILEAKNQWMFDSQELKRANIDIAKLPPESVLINVKPSFYSQYRTLVWILITLFSSGTVIITVLAYAIRRQKQAERLLKEHEKQLEQHVKERTSELSTTLEKLKQTQTQLIQTEKMSSLGQLVGGVAHELNNPLNFLSGNVRCAEDYVVELLEMLQLYQKQSVLSEAIRQYREEIDLDYIQQDIPSVLKSIREGASRIQKIVSGLQAFSRSDEQGTKSTDIHASLESTLSILNLQLSGSAEVDRIEILRNYEKVPNIVCNPGEINQVFLSILMNAIEAMRSHSSSLKQLSIKTSVSSDNTVQISIKDTGPGIPNNIESKIFDPFFTTKPIGEGTGLGLAIAYQIIQKHNGTIQVYSIASNSRTTPTQKSSQEPNVRSIETELTETEPTGTEFIIELPIATPTQQRPTPQPSAQLSAHPSINKTPRQLTKSAQK